MNSTHSYTERPSTHPPEASTPSSIVKSERWALVVWSFLISTSPPSSSLDDNQFQVPLSSFSDMATAPPLDESIDQAIQDSAAALMGQLVLS